MWIKTGEGKAEEQNGQQMILKYILSHFVAVFTKHSFFNKILLLHEARYLESCFYIGENNLQKDYFQPNKINKTMEMKSIFKTMVMAALCLGTVTFASCGDDNDDKNTGLKFSTTKVNVAPKATAKVKIGNGAQPFTVKSTDEKIATAKVDKNIITVTGVKEGSTSITVTDKNKLFGTISVNVATPLTFDKSSLEIAVGKEGVVTVKNGNAPYMVSVMDKKIATASVKKSNIIIKGMKAGTTTVNVLDKNKLAGTITVTVK